MADYININGNNIPIRASDPSNPILGEVWYNLTTNALKGRAFTASAFSTQSAMPTATRSGGGAGTETAGLAWCGDNPGGRASQTYEYDGTNWTSTGSLGTARGNFNNGVGTQTAAQATGGVTPGVFYGNNEQFNGTSWSEQNDLNTARGSMAQSGQGSQTSAIVAGGTAPPAPAPPGSTTVETWDGTSWAAGTALPTANIAFAGAGVLNSFLTFGGAPYPSVGNTTNLWNGSTWTSQPTLNTARQGLSGSGSSTLALAFGGEAAPYRAETESFNGSTWTNEASLSSARQSAAEGNSATAALCVSGEGATTAFTEEWTQAGATNNQLHSLVLNIDFIFIKVIH
jgi:hypothetical protein